MGKRIVENMLTVALTINLDYCISQDFKRSINSSYFIWMHVVPAQYGENAQSRV